MLRASAIAFGYSLDDRCIADPSIPSGVPGGNALLRLVDATMTDAGDVHHAHKDVLDSVGPEGLVDAAAVFGNFEMMNRVAEGSGIPVPAAMVEREAETVTSLGLERFIKHSSSQ